MSLVTKFREIFMSQEFIFYTIDLFDFIDSLTVAYTNKYKFRLLTCPYIIQGTFKIRAVTFTSSLLTDTPKVLAN